MTGDKWMTSGANRLKARMNRTFERRASLDGPTPSPRISGSYGPSTTTKNHPNFIKRNLRGLTGTFTKAADPVYRRGVLPSSPRRAPLHEENEYPPGAILPRRDRDIRSTAYQGMPYSVNAASFPYQDQRDRSPHPHLQSQNVAFHEPPRQHAAYRYVPNVAAGPQYLIQPTIPLHDEISYLQDGTCYQEQNAAHYRDSQSGDQGEWTSREHIVQQASLRASIYDSFLQNHNQAEVPFTPQYPTYSGASHQLAQMPGDSERGGIPQFRNPHRKMTFDRSTSLPRTVCSPEAFHFEPRVFPQHSRTQYSIDDMTNRNSLGGYNSVMVNPNVGYPAPIEPSVCERLSTGNAVSYNGENLEHNGRDGFCERQVSDQKTSLLGLLRQNQDFGVQSPVTEVPKGIDRFKSRAQPEEKSDESDASRRAVEGTQGNATIERNPTIAPSPNNKRPLANVNTIEVTTAKGAEDESADRDSKRLRVADSTHYNAQKENVSLPTGGEPRSIGSALAIQFFNGTLEVDVCGRPLNTMQNPKHSNENQSPNLGTDPFGTMGWDNESSLWG